MHRALYSVLCTTHAALLWLLLPLGVEAQTQHDRIKTRGSVLFLITAAPACALGDFFIYADSATNKLRKCDNGTLSDLAGAGGGITTLNTLTATTQVFAVGTAGTDFGISSVTATHTFNLPTASATVRGALASADWSTFNAKQAGDADLTALAALSVGTPGFARRTGADAWALFAASGSGSPTACTNQVVTTFTLNDNAAPTSTCTTITSAFTSGTFDPDAHALVGAKHTASGLTVGQPLRATGGTTFAFGALDLANLDATANLLPGSRGGTNNAFFQVAGPAVALKTYTFPDANSTMAALGTVQTWTALQTYRANTWEVTDSTDTTKKSVFGLTNIPTTTTRTVNVAGTANSTTIVSLICPGTNKVSAISADGVITCSTDEGGTGGDNITVAGTAATDANFSNTNPAAPADGVNLRFQLDTVPAPDDISANLQFATASLAGAVSTAAQTIAGSKTFNALTLFQGSAATDRVEVENPDNPAEDSFADSPFSLFTGIRDSLAGAGVTREEVNWRRFADVTAVAGTSTYVWQSRIGAAAFAERAKLTDGGVFDVATGFRIAGVAATGARLRGNGTNFISDATQLAGVGSCTNQFVTATVNEAAPTCTTATLASAQFANQGTTTTVLHGNAAGNPSFAAVSLTADVSGILPGANGGTNNGFMEFTGPATTLKTFTLPNVSETIATLGQTQTFTGIKTFNSSSFLLAGATSGTTTVNATAAASGIITVPAATDTLVARATADTLTNKTLDVEAAGNSVTTVSKIYIDAASCVGAAGALNWDDAGTGDTAPTAACNDTGSIQRTSANFSGTLVNSFERTMKLPSDWAGNVDVALRYVSTAAAPAGNVEWDISTICRAVGETWDAAFNAVQTITDAQAAQNTLNDATQTTVTMTTCAAGEDWTLKISRDGVNDTSNDIANLLGVEITLRRAQ